MNMASLLSNQAASTVENSINVEIETSEITENPADTELETSLEPKPSARKESLVQQETAFFLAQENLASSVSDPYHFDLDPDPEVTFDSVNRIFPIKCYARL